MIFWMYCFIRKAKYSKALYYNYFIIQMPNSRSMRELKPLRLQKTHANRKSTSKSRKSLHQFDSRCCKCSQHKQIKNFIWSAFLYLVVLWPFAARVLSNWRSCFLKLQVFCSQFAVHLFIWLCCEHLQRVLSNWQSCFLNLQVFLSIFSALNSLDQHTNYNQQQ